MNEGYPSMLMIPTSSSSPASPASIQTGRPPMWTSSNQRKLCRLYLYTTLKIDKILEVVHYPMPAESIPGKDSANKKLNALLDKQPRWLKPQNDIDMRRRCEQLAQSPTRSAATAPSSLPPTRPHSYSAPPPFLQGSTTPIKEEYDIHSASLDVPSWSHSPVGQFSSTPYYGTPNSQLAGASFPRTHGRSISADHGESTTSHLTRVDSHISSSTDQTTGSFHRILGDYDDSYVQTVKKLVKRFTSPHNQMDMSSPSDIVSSVSSWLHDHVAPSVFSNSRPFPLPGDFLSLDIHLREPCPFFPESLQHQKRRCMCHAHPEVSGSCWLWATASGLTPYANQLVSSGPSRAFVEAVDAFGNTMLHFLAARGQVALLFRALDAGFCEPILNVQNSAGQTFLHVISAQWFQNLEALIHLLDNLKRTQNFDFSVRDNYGRSFIHSLYYSGIRDTALRFILQRYRGITISSRDAFNTDAFPDVQPPRTAFPGAPTQPGPSSGDDPEKDPLIIRESRLLGVVNRASSDPRLEDEDGRNGLHCLAMASLSVDSLMNKVNLSPCTSRRRQTKRDHGSSGDSSTDRLSLRLSQTESLLKAGVDPNHHDIYGNTPLMAFCAELPEDDDYKTGPKILQLLLDKGANINARNRAGETALHIAVRCGRKLATKKLIDARANVHARDADGRGVLSVADAKMKSCSEDALVEYCHYEACRAHLSGKGLAVQEPTVLQEWGLEIHA